MYTGYWTIFLGHEERNEFGNQKTIRMEVKDLFEESWATNYRFLTVARHVLKLSYSS